MKAFCKVRTGTPKELRNEGKQAVALMLVRVKPVNLTRVPSYHRQYEAFVQKKSLDKSGGLQKKCVKAVTVKRAAGWNQSM